MAVYDTRRKNWEDLDVTREELENITDCLKKEEFRKLLRDYADEITNPENRKLFEKEIIQLEKERGVDVTFVNPEPGYVIKTSVDGSKKCFVNISQNVAVDKPASQPSYVDGYKGLKWSIPYTLAPPRDDLDKENRRCVVFDVVFHPDTIHLASKNVKFRNMVNETALNGIESSFHVKLDRNNIRFPKLAFKGSSQPTVIRKKSEKSAESQLDLEPEIYQKIMSNYDEHRAKMSKLPEVKRSPPTTKYSTETKSDCHNESIYTVPKYVIKHQNDVDIHEFQNHRNAKLHATIPSKLVVVIDLPLLETSDNAALQVHEKSLTLKSEKPAKYKLTLSLPYPVNPDNGTAKFDVKSKVLTITLPVVRGMIPFCDNKEDSGVESDHGSPVIELRDDTSAANLEPTTSNNSLENVEELITVINTRSEVSDGEDTALRTSPSIVPFLNPDVKYSLPNFSCSLYDKMLAFTIHSKNVDPASIRNIILSPEAGFHITMTSVGTGFFPVYYSLRVQIGDQLIDPTSLTIEPWDNNVVVNIMLKNVDGISNYFVGLDEDSMLFQDLPSVVSLKNKLEELMIESRNESKKSIQVIEDGDDVVINITPNQAVLDSSSKEEEVTMSRRGMQRSVSESSGDETNSNHSNIRRSKGILKSRRGSLGRSVSESSVDDSAILASSTDLNWDSIPEIHSESGGSSLKKTVRFNDVVARQLYRSNSSILGQRKKNQRKLRNKKRAHDRRTSESENSESEERDKYRTCVKTSSERVDSSENVKPILNQQKSVLHLQSECIDIETEKNSNLYQSKRSHQSTNETSWHVNEDEKNFAEAKAFKNDLIFDLDI